MKLTTQVASQMVKILFEWANSEGKALGADKLLADMITPSAKTAAAGAKSLTEYLFENIRDDVEEQLVAGRPYAVKFIGNDVVKIVPLEWVDDNGKIIR